MPRRPRNYLPGYTYHLVQRGVNRAATFFNHEDYLSYLTLWEYYSQKFGLGVHAYCLMANHIHFLVTPTTADSISFTTRLVGSRYANRVNKKYSRTGTLWEGRHWASLIDDESYLLRCYRYIELNPVRANTCLSPAEYQWSSYRLNTDTSKSWLTPHPIFQRLGKSAEERGTNYSAFVSQGCPEEELNTFTKGFRKNRPTANVRIIKNLELKHQIDLGKEKCGRPWPEK